MLRGLLVVAGVALALACAASMRAADSASPLPFWPQGGVIGRDLYLGNFVDLDPAAGVTLDPFCGHRTYDTHSGDDVTIRSFREAAIGVPVFSATDGTVREVVDGYYDWHYGSNVSAFDNHVVVDAADGRTFVYGHLRHGIRLRKGVKVRAGRQLGWTASSGNSSWPHLHLTEIVGQTPRDPFAGPCNPGPSGFVSQPALPDGPYVRNLVASPQPFRGHAQLPWDAAKRTGTFVRGSRDLWFRVELGEYSPAAERVQLVRPDGSVGLDDASPDAVVDGIGQGHGQAAFDLHERATFDVPGTWRLRYLLGGRLLADAPLTVVAQPSPARNRAPSAVGVSLVPAAPHAHEPAECVVATPLVARDPDYDIVRYRYRWTVAGRVVRSVWSAALSDELARDAAKPGQRISCAVTPSDGKLSARPAAVSATAA